MFNALRTRLAKRAQYKRIVEEIMSMDERELKDLATNRDEIMREAYHEVYG